MSLEPVFCTSVIDERSAECMFATGEIDVATASVLRDQLRVAIERRPIDVVVDFADVTFIDSSGLSEPVIANSQLAAFDSSLSLRHVRPAVRRTPAISALDSLIAIEDCQSCEGRAIAS